MTEDQKIYELIGRRLWSIMPPNAFSIYCVGMIYSDTHQVCPEWINKDGSIVRFDFDEYPIGVCNQLTELFIDLKKLPIFENEPWTHAKAALLEDGKFKIEFAYIPQGDSWPGLFMRRVSELTEDEAKEFFIPYEDWKSCVELYSYHR